MKINIYDANGKKTSKTELSGRRNLNPAWETTIRAVKRRLEGPK